MCTHIDTYVSYIIFVCVYVYFWYVVCESVSLAINLSFFKIFFLIRITSKVFIECYSIVSVRHVGSELPIQGLNPQPLHWKVTS